MALLFFTALNFSASGAGNNWTRANSLRLIHCEVRQALSASRLIHPDNSEKDMPISQMTEADIEIMSSAINETLADVADGTARRSTGAIRRRMRAAP
jgi:hypothetical protein